MNRDTSIPGKTTARIKAPVFVPAFAVAAALAITASLCVFSAFLLLRADSPAGGGGTFTEAEGHENSGARNIYVGDIISLDIAPGGDTTASAGFFDFRAWIPGIGTGVSDFRTGIQGINAAELRELFKDFDITDLREQNGGYQISLRAFEPGEYKIALGNNDLTISVASTLDDISRDDVFEGGLDVVEPGPAFQWRVFFAIAAGVCALSGGYAIIKTIVNNKRKTADPFGGFLFKSGALSTENKLFFVELTRYFKDYLEGVYHRRIIGKTSSEIIGELSDIQTLSPMLADIKKWLAECDRIKFTGSVVSADEKNRRREELIGVVTQINALKCDTSAGDTRGEGAA